MLGEISHYTCSQQHQQDDDVKVKKIQLQSERMVHMEKLMIFTLEEGGDGGDKQGDDGANGKMKEKCDEQVKKMKMARR